MKNKLCRTSIFKISKWAELNIRSISVEKLTEILYKYQFSECVQEIIQNSEEGFVKRYHPDYKNLIQLVCWKCLRNCRARYAIEIKGNEICQCPCGCKNEARTEQEIYKISQ